MLKKKVGDLGKSRAGQTLVLAILMALLSMFFGQVAAPWIVRYLGRIDISSDGILRALSVETAARRHGIPVAIVDIDSQTWTNWGAPAATPRKELTNILQNLTVTGHGRGPLAIVLDIDLSVPQENDELLPFLEQYPTDRPPIVFPKRLNEAPDGTVAPVDSDYDRVLADRDNLVWADATLDSDSDGVVRQWPVWREVCTGAGTSILPSIPARLSALVAAADGTALLPRPSPPVLSGDCRRRASAIHLPRLLVTTFNGRRSLTGSGATIMTEKFVSVPARLVADSHARRDDEALFGGKVVFIGASHEGSRDFHRTAYGNLTGVEILAQQVYLAPLSGMKGPSYGLGFKMAVIAVLAMLVAADLLMRRLRVITQVILLALVAWFAIRLLHSYTVFEVILVAISLMIVLVGIRQLWSLVGEWKAEPDKRRFFFSLPQRKNENPRP